MITDLLTRLGALDPFTVIYAFIIGSAVFLAGLLAWDALSDRDPRPLADRPEWTVGELRDLGRMADEREAAEANLRRG